MLPIKLPTKLIPYDFDSLNAKKLRPVELAMIYRSAQEADFGVMIDAIGSTLDQDILKLTIPDFYYVLYWHRLVSYTNSPFVIEWRSKYGSTEKTVLTFDNLKVDYLGLTKEEYQDYVMRGFAMPTVADLLALDGLKIGTDDRWIYEAAQFLSGPSIDARVQRIRDAEDLTIIEDIRAFNKATSCGVVTVIPLKASTPIAELITINREAGRIELLNEISRTNFVQDVEDVVIGISAQTFFPNM